MCQKKKTRKPQISRHQRTGDLPLKHDLSSLNSLRHGVHNRSFHIRQVKPRDVAALDERIVDPFDRGLHIPLVCAESQSSSVSHTHMATRCITVQSSMLTSHSGEQARARTAQHHMLLAFRINVKLLVTQSKQRSLRKLSCLPAQPTLSHRLQRRYHRPIPTQGLACRREHSQLSQALCMMLLAPALQLWLHVCPRMICFKQERIYHVREEASVCQEQRLVRVRDAELQGHDGIGSGCNAPIVAVGTNYPRPSREPAYQRHTCMSARVEQSSSCSRTTVDAMNLLTGVRRVSP